MMAVLRRKLNELVHGEEGVALVVTLALFMFMFVSCAGVFAVGRAVKERIILQNAVDAAAYSAAVVQADMLSRIATLNRTLASTYNSMVLRQMDYINYKWLDAAIGSSTDPGTYEGTKIKSSYIGSAKVDGSGKILLTNGNGEFEHDPDKDSVQSECANFQDDKADEEIGGLKFQVQAMNDCISNLVHAIPGAMEETAKKVLEANLPVSIARKCGAKIKVDAIEKWMRPMAESDSEETFVTLAANGDEAWTLLQDRNWFVFAKNEDGYERAYTEDKEKGLDLLAQWHWFDMSGNYQGTVEHWASQDWDEAFKGEPAVPYVVREEYFTQATGAVSVAVVCKNENPWKEFVTPNGDSYGIYDAFRPSAAADYTLAVASAQAGYRPAGLGEAAPADVEEGTASDWRNYRLVGGNVPVYAKTDDWDALFIPVSRALSGGRFKEKIIAGDWEPVVAGVKTLDDIDLDESKAALPHMHNNNAENAALQWSELLNLMYH